MDLKELTKNVTTKQYEDIKHNADSIRKFRPISQLNEKQQSSNDSKDYNFDYKNENVDEYLELMNYYSKGKVDKSTVETKDTFDVNSNYQESYLDHAVETYNLNFWKERIKVVDESLIKRIVEGIIKEESMKSPDSIQEICYVLTASPYPGLNEIFSNPDDLIFQIFMRPEDETRNVSGLTLEDKQDESLLDSNKDIEFKYHNIFKGSLGVYGYESLLRTLNNSSTKKSLKKVLKHMNQYGTVITDRILHYITNICKQHEYPLILKDLFKVHLNKIVWKVTKVKLIYSCLI